MAVLIDTNVLLRGLQPLSPGALLAKSAIDSLRRRGEVLFVAAQNVIEFWAVATRPLANNGLGLSVEVAASEIAAFRELFEILPESPLVMPEWERLVSQYRVVGKSAHDARLVAAMNVNRVGKVLTFDVGDFTRFTEIQAIHPETVR